MRQFRPASPEGWVQSLRQKAWWLVQGSDNLCMCVCDLCDSQYEAAAGILHPPRDPGDKSLPLGEALEPKSLWEASGGGQGAGREACGHLQKKRTREM